MESVSTAPLWGTWKLVSCRLRTISNEGVESFQVGPFGSDPLGRITMTPDGYFSVLSTSTEATSQGHISNWSTGLAEDIATVARPMVTYCGPFSAWKEGQDSVLCIDVEVALNPTLIGATMKRIWTIRQENKRILLALKGKEQHTMPVSLSLLLFCTAS